MIPRCVVLVFQLQILRNVKLTPYDGLYLLVQTSVIKLHNPVHIAVVGDCDGSRSRFRSLVHQSVYSAATVQKTVFGVIVQMNEFFHISLKSFSPLVFFQPFR